MSYPLEHDFITGKEQEISMDEFLSPEDLWYRYKVGKNSIPSPTGKVFFLASTTAIGLELLNPMSQAIEYG